MLPSRLCYLNLILLFLGGCASDPLETDVLSEEKSAEQPQRRMAHVVVDPQRQSRRIFSLFGDQKDVSQFTVRPVGHMGIPDACLEYINPPQRPSKSVIACIDTRYFSLLDPKFEDAIVRLYNQPLPGLPPITIEDINDDDSFELQASLLSTGSTLGNSPSYSGYPSLFQNSQAQSLYSLQPSGRRSYTQQLQKVPYEAAPYAMMPDYLGLNRQPGPSLERKNNWIFGKRRNLHPN